MRHYKLGVFAHNFDSKLPGVLDTKELTSAMSMTPGKTSKKFGSAKLFKQFKNILTRC